MKTKITVILLLIYSISLTSFAQIKKESILLGGQVSYSNYKLDKPSSQSSEEYKNASFNISLGKAIKENSVVGINLLYAPSSNLRYIYGSNLGSTKSKSYGLGIFYRKYNKLAKDFYFFAELEGSYFNARNQSVDSMGVKMITYKSSAGQINITPGLSYKVYKKLHLELLIPNIASIQYSTSKEGPLNTQIKRNSFNFNTSLNNPNGGLSFLGVGFRFIF